MFIIIVALAGLALGIGTTYILRKSAKRVYAFTTFAPWLYMIVTVFTAGVGSVSGNLALLANPGVDPTKTVVNIILTSIMMALAVIVSADCVRKWVTLLWWPKRPTPEAEPEGDLMGLAEGTEIAD